MILENGMKVLVSHMPADYNELLADLRQGFNQDYSYELFGFGLGRSVVIRKGPFVGVRVFLRPKKNRIIVSGHFPSTFVQVFLGGLIFIAFVYGKWKRMERETAAFLKDKYGGQ